MNSQRKKIKNSKINKEYLEKIASIFLPLFPIKVKSIFDPSSGGIGIKLKIAKTILSKTTTDASETKDALKKPVATEILITSPKKIAIARFAKIPADATHNVPIFLSLKFSGLYGTGFAQPIKNGALVKTKIRGKITEPKGSKCFKGFSVSRPAYSAVLSPKYKAA